MSQDRLRKILVLAVDAAKASPDWQDGDELCVILADSGATVLSSRGFGAGGLLACLDFHAGKLRQAAALER